MAIKSVTGLSKFIWGLARLKAKTFPQPIQTELVDEEETEKEVAVISEPVVEAVVPITNEPTDNGVEEVPPEEVKKKLIDYCIFMQTVINITTRANTLTHLGYQAWDIAGLDGNSQDVFAPFRCKVLTKYPYPSNSGKVNSGNTFIIGSCDENGNPTEVMWENGEKHIMSIAITHDNNISDISVGQIFNSGEILCQEGKAGNATGNHVHIEPAIGWQYFKHLKKTSKGWFYVIDNNCDIGSLFFRLKDYTKDKNLNGYTFKEVVERSFYK